MQCTLSQTSITIYSLHWSRLLLEIVAHWDLFQGLFLILHVLEDIRERMSWKYQRKHFLRPPKKEDQLWSHWIKSSMSYIFTLNYTTLEVFWKSNWISNMETNVDYSFVNACNSKCHCNFTCAKFNMNSVWPPTQCNLTQKRGTVDCGAVCCVFFSVWNMNLIPILTSIVFTLFSQGQNDRKRIVFFFSSLDAMCQIEKIPIMKKIPESYWKTVQHCVKITSKSDPIKLTGILKLLKWDFYSYFNGK